MHSPFPAAPGLLAQATVPPAPPTLRQSVDDLLQQLHGSQTQILVFLGLAVVVMVIAYWLASKPLAEERSGLGSAIKILFYYALVLAIGGAVALASSVMIPMALATFKSGHPIGPLVTIVGFGVLSLVAFLLALYFLFFIPIRTYRITLPGAVVFLVIANLLSAAGWWGLNLAMGHPVTPKGKLVVPWQELNPTTEIKPLFTHQPDPYDLAEQRASDRTRPIADRQSALKEMYDRLKSTREALPPGDASALAEYEKRWARYEKLLNELRAEVAAHRGSEV